MDPNSAIEVEGLNKLYYLEGRRPAEGIRDLLLAPLKRRNSTAPPPEKIEREVELGHAFWALKDINLTVRRGEVLGIIGRNGAGKSTLLKILSRITAPTSGRARMRGRVVSLLEVGTGFHEELTGRENVYLNGAILGMSSEEISRKLDAIIEFSGVSRFIDTPVKYYSSGMRVRLGFSVAAHVEPEILIIDEVLAVGDAAFQEKCLNRVNALSGDAQRTVIFVSHSMAAVGALCTRTVLVDGGRIVADGSTGEVIKRYHEVSGGENGTVELSQRRDRIGTGHLRMTRIVLQDSTGRPVSYVKSGERVKVAIEYEASPELVGARDILANIVFSNSKGVRLFGVPSDVIHSPKAEIQERGSLVCTIGELPLIAGHYEIDLAILVERELADKVMRGGAITVAEGDFHNTNRMPQPNFGDLLVHYDWDFSPSVHDAASSKTSLTALI